MTLYGYRDGNLCFKSHSRLRPGMANSDLLLLNFDRCSNPTRFREESLHLGMLAALDQVL
jgi:hypothetical protein